MQRYKKNLSNNKAITVLILTNYISDTFPTCLIMSVLKPQQAILNQKIKTLSRLEYDLFNFFTSTVVLIQYFWLEPVHQFCTAFNPCNLSKTLILHGILVPPSTVPHLTDHQQNVAKFFLNCPFSCTIVYIAIVATFLQRSKYFKDCWFQ